MDNNRDCRIDIVRAFCALEIIAFWHMMDYLPESCALAGKALSFAKLLTNTALATFAFISGFCLQKYTFNNTNDILFFYKRRLIRFYPLLLLSAVSLLVAGFIFHHHWFTSISQFVTTLTGLNIFFPPITMTLWYFSMIMFFYLITPPILFMKNMIKKMSVAVLIFIVITTVDALFIDVDIVFYLYYPFYVLGLILPSATLKYVYNKKILLPCSLVMFTFCVVMAKETNDYNTYMAMISGLVALLLIADFVLKFEKVAIPLFWISNSSMVAYLFHRQFYFVITKFIGDSNQELSLPIALCVAVPIIFTISFALQKFYDLILLKCKSKN